MESIPTKMDKADEHLDRLGSILRSLRAPPPDRELSSTAVPIDRPEARRQDRLRSSEDPQQQQQQQQHLQQQQQQHQHQQQNRQHALHQDQQRRIEEHQQQRRGFEQQQKHQHQHQKQNHEQQVDERLLLCASFGSSVSPRLRSRVRPRTASQSSQTEMTITTPPVLRPCQHQHQPWHPHQHHQEQHQHQHQHQHDKQKHHQRHQRQREDHQCSTQMVMGRPTTTLKRDDATPAKNQNRGTSSPGWEHRQAWQVPVHSEHPTPKHHQRLIDNDDGEDLRAEAGERVLPAPSSTINTAPPVVQSGGGTADAAAAAAAVAAATSAPAAAPALEVKPSVQGKATSSPLSLVLRERAVRTWWRGLSCGLCFAAGAWAREGHAVLGAVLAVTAVCGEMVLHELNAPRSDFNSKD
ncbi:unnamed protein product [Pylaiella littoralis]